MFDALTKLPETLSQIFNIDQMAEETRKNALKIYVKEIVDAYTDENGVTYNHVYSANLNQRDMRRSPLTTLDKYVDDQAHTLSLIEALQEVIDVGKIVYGADTVNVYSYDGIVIFEAYFPNGEFKLHFGYEED